MSNRERTAPANCFSNYFAIIAVSGQWLIIITARDKKRIRKLRKSLQRQVRGWLFYKSGSTKLNLQSPP